MSRAIYHVVSGDSLASELKSCGFEGNVIVCRECLIDGPLDGETLQDFLANRAEFLGKEFPDNGMDYFEGVAAEFEKIAAIPSASEVNLWFGNDLFCQANMWFAVGLLPKNGSKVFRVFPYSAGQPDTDFSSDDCGDLRASLAARRALSGSDFQLLRELWQAYKTGDLNTLSALSKIGSDCFRDLEQTCRAHIECFGDDPRPERVLREIIASGLTEFKDIFPEFSRREPIYGFGDLQVKRLLENL